MSLPPELLERMRRATAMASKMSVEVRWQEAVVEALQARCEVLEGLYGRFADGRKSSNGPHRGAD